ncbi:MAG: TonB-dependent receptor [Saprospiraceae bacterium]|nr:TonB-dependent receptor [Saprospiraceae bacterium]
MRFLVISVLLLGLPGLTHAQNTDLRGTVSEQARIYGLITDAETGEPLSLAHVQILPLNSGSVTDEAGQYQLADIPAGFYGISASSLGYHQIQHDSILVTPGDQLELNFSLEIASIQQDEVIVTAARRAQAVALAPASVAMISANQIASQNLQTFDQAFDGITGVQVTRSSGSNIQALSIRGASEVAGGGIGNRVLLLIDGRPSLSPESGGALWNLVPLQSIDRIEVVKGAYSSLFGSSAMGGVINVITKVPATRTTTSGHVNYGLYDPTNRGTYQEGGQYYTAEISHGGSLDKWKYLLNAGRKSNTGHREKSAFDINHLFGKVIYQANTKDKWILSGNFNQINNDAPATWLNSRLAYSVAPHRLDDFQEKREFNTDLNYQSLRNGNLKYDGRVYYYRNYSFFSFNDDKEDKSDNNVNFGKQSVDEESITADRVGAAFQVDYHIPKHYFIFGTDIKTDYVNGVPDTVLYGKHRSLSGGIYVQDEIPIGQQIIATMGLRYDYFNLENSFSESNFSPKVAAVWKKNDRLALRILFAQAFRNPSMAERFIKFEQGGGLRFQPNPELRAEKLTASIEFGGSYHFSKSTSLDIAIFHNNYKDLISFRQLPDPRGGLLYQVINLNKAVMQGLEVNIKTQVGKVVRASLGYTFLDARDVSDTRFNNNLAYKIKHSLNASLAFTYKPLSLQLNGRYRSAVKEVFIYPGSEPDAYTLYNAKLNYRFTDNVNGYFAIDNFTNTAYEELERYRMPVRGYTLGMRFEL